MRQQWPEQAAFIAEAALRRLKIRRGGAGFVVVRSEAAATFVGGEIGKAEERDRDVGRSRAADAGKAKRGRRSFARQEIAVVRAAEFFDQLDPQPAVVFELGSRVGVENLTDEAGGHAGWG